MHVVGLDVGGHLGDGRPAGLGRLPQPALDAVRQPLDVERVAEDGLRQLARRAGELTEHQHPVLPACLLDGHVLLADQVHAVDQGGDEQGVGRRVVGGELLLGQAPVQVVHGYVVAGLGEPPVDPPDVLLDGGAQLAVLPHVVPAGHGDLQKGQAGPVLGGALQQHLHGQQPFHDALGVVEAVDPEQQGTAGELVDQRGHVGVGLRRGGVPDEVGRVDRDRCGDGLHQPAVGQRDRRPAHLDARAGQQPPAGLYEVAAVPLGVEGHHVRPQQPDQDLLPPRQPGEDVRRRPGYVQEEPDRLLRPPPADELGDQHQVVVVYPGERIRLLGQGRQRPVGEHRVHVPVGGPPGSLEAGLLDRVVQQRPQRRVGEAVVVVADLGAGQADRL